MICTMRTPSEKISNFSSYLPCFHDSGGMYLWSPGAIVLRVWSDPLAMHLESPKSLTFVEIFLQFTVCVEPNNRMSLPVGVFHFQDGCMFQGIRECLDAGFSVKLHIQSQTFPTFHSWCGHGGEKRNLSYATSSQHKENHFECPSKHHKMNLCQPVHLV